MGCKGLESREFWGRGEGQLGEKEGRKACRGQGMGEIDVWGGEKGATLLCLEEPVGEGGQKRGLKWRNGSVEAKKGTRGSGILRKFVGMEEGR